MNVVEENKLNQIICEMFYFFSSKLHIKYLNKIVLIKLFLNNCF